MFGLILLFAFAARMTGLDAVRHEFDWAAPHAAGIGILEALARGDFAALPTLGAGASIVVPNPVLSSYFWAVVNLFSRDPLFATAISAMLGVVTVALTIDLTRRLMGRTAAVWAGVLAATSPWSLYFARGTWLQGQTEFCAALVAWVIVVALQQQRAKRLLMGLIIAAILAHTYLVAFGLLGQAGLASLIGFRRKLARAAILGFGVCLLSVAVFGLLILGRVQWSNYGVRPDQSNTQVSVAAFTLRLNPDSIAHTLRLVSGRDHEVAGEDRQTALQSPDKQWTDARATFIDVMIGIGLILLLTGGLTLRGGRRLNGVLCGWLILPPLISVLVTLRFTNWLVHPAYMLLTAPAGYLVAAAPIAWLAAWLRTHAARLQPLAAAAMAVLLVPTTTIALNREAAFVQDSYLHPFAGRLAWLPLRDQANLRALWQANCDTITTDEDVLWTASVAQSKADVLPASMWRSKRRTLSGRVWQLPANGRLCLTQLARTLIPFTARIPMTLADGTTITTTQIALPTTPASTKFSTKFSTNIGWNLLNLITPAQATAGLTVTVQHTWQIETLPGEDYASWYYAPFVKLIGPDGQQLLQVDSAPSVLGSEWRAGDAILSQVNLRLPAELQPGAYTLEISLFDPNQGKNAVYFEPNDPERPIVSLRRPLQVEPAQASTQPAAPKATAKP